MLSFLASAATPICIGEFRVQLVVLLISLKNVKKRTIILNKLNLNISTIHMLI